MTKKVWRTKGTVTNNDGESMDNSARTVNNSASMDEDDSDVIQILVKLY